jgi:hypothetical protein
MILKSCFFTTEWETSGISIHERNLVALLLERLVCIYSQRTAMKDLGILRFAPQFFEGLNFTHLASQLAIHSSVFFNYLTFASPCQFFVLI